MRANKNRSRHKNPRRSLGNVVSRVFESAGPESKVRGTPQQIIEKYAALARDAMISGDRVAAENFLQHAEHYSRMLAEAQRELDPQREPGSQPQLQNGAPSYGAEEREEREEREESALATFDEDGHDDGGLVITPEGRADPRRERHSERHSERPADRHVEAPAPLAVAPEVPALVGAAPPEAAPQQRPYNPRPPRNRSRGPRRHGEGFAPRTEEAEPPPANPAPPEAPTG